ncbi:DUF3466 family protein [Vibrio genomosp. F6]|uniref:DUF3466 family protein n=1 Tax=Vibrio genomosp. F6 str. FF-238 TaxID=1191298 RepID=A0A1E5D757_9VIBR|nr:DUF3466 family protein [Vibrio genomosp. F6]OEE79443.1 hypothetical protein A130_02270 [Vibrio genomosp. F6 str. FF-238]
MNFKSATFKLSAIAATVLAATSANAALYKIVEVAPTGISADQYVEVYGEAIQPVASTYDAGINQLGCFEASADSTVCEAYKLAGDTRNWAEGVSYREEAPFGMDNSFSYVQEAGDFEDYCDSFLGYNTCKAWASTEWSGYKKELNKEQNALAFVEGDAGVWTNSYFNNVINALTANGDPVGNQSVIGDTRNQAVAPNSSSLTGGPYHQSRAWFSDGTYTVGSISSAYTNDNGDYYSTKAAIWDGTTTTEIAWYNDDEDDSDVLAQASLRSFYVDDADNKIIAVGFNNYDDQYMNATVFESDSKDLSAATWTQKAISGVQRTASDSVYLHSTAVDINKNQLILGQAKLRKPKNGAYAEELFVSFNGADTKILTETQSIFFKGAGGKAGAINNFNEIVGQIDAETNREEGGRARKHRGFIYPYGTQVQGSVSDRQAIFGNKAWWLDDLTNGETDGDLTISEANNAFRVIDATDINDAGVISATAIKCSVAGGYDTTSHNSYCGGGDTQEQIVAVKLIPISGATKGDIHVRSNDQTAVERQGAGLGWLVLTMLGLFSFRRK